MSTETLFIPQSIAKAPKVADPERDALYPTMIATSVAIEKNDLPKLTHLLGITPLTAISQTFFDDLLEEYLSRCERIIREKQLDRVEAGKVIFEHFSQEYNRRIAIEEGGENPLSEIPSDTLDMPLRIYMLMSLTFSDSTLRLVRKLCPDDTFEEQMHDLIDADEVPMTAYAVRRLLEQYPDKPLETYMNLYAYAEEKKNDTLVDFLEDKVKEMAPPCKKPSYMRTFDEKLTLPNDDCCNHNHLVDMATLLMERLGTFRIEIKGKDNVEDAQKYITSILLSSVSQRNILLQAITKGTEDGTNDHSLHDEKIIFSLLGPLNAFPMKLPGSPDCICMYYGGCRMFGCCEFEIDDEDEEIIPSFVKHQGGWGGEIIPSSGGWGGEIIPSSGGWGGEITNGSIMEDWYTGNCEFCFLKIPNRFWSVRRPLSSGGWKGCYCTWGCVREEIIDLNLREGASLIALTETMEADMHEIGIADQ